MKMNEHHENDDTIMATGETEEKTRILLKDNGASGSGKKCEQV